MATSKNSAVVYLESGHEIFYRMGKKAMEEKDFDRAVHFMEKAVAVCPYHGEYMYDLASSYSELGRAEESNHLLADIIRYVDPTMTECYFGMGCNYFDLGRFDQARIYFQKYVDTDTQRQFVQEAYDALYYLKLYESTQTDKKLQRRLEKLMSQAKEHMAKSEYDQACSLLEKGLELDECSAPLRNLLSEAYFLGGDVHRAVSIAESVLKAEFDDLQAQCNLLRYYNALKERSLFKKQYTYLTNARVESGEEFSILAATWWSLGMKEELQLLIMRHITAAGKPGVILREFFKSPVVEESLKSWVQYHTSPRESGVSTQVAHRVIQRVREHQS